MTASPHELSLTEAFSVLQLSPTATAAEIRKSYRTLSLRLHPDKAKDVSPEIAATRFDNLHKAYELLSDPVVREKLEKEADEQRKREERMGKFERERKAMSDALEKREREEASRKRDELDQARRQQMELERLKEQGRKLREAKSKARGQELANEMKKDEDTRRAQATTQNSSDTAATQRASGFSVKEPKLGPLDMTVRLLYPAALWPTLSPILEGLLEEYLGPLLHFRQTPPANEAEAIGAEQDKKRKRRSAEVVCLATFQSLTSAVRLVELGADFHLADLAPSPSSANPIAHDDLDQIWIEWAAAKDAKKKRKEVKKSAEADQSAFERQEEADKRLGVRVGEPERITWYRKHEPATLEAMLGKKSTDGVNSKTERTSGGPSQEDKSQMNSSDFEADVLRRAMEAAAKKRQAAAEIP